MSLLWIQSLWVISSGTLSASLRLGFSKVERVLSLTGEFPELGTVPYPLKGFANSTRNIESVIKACSTPLFAYIFQWHTANLCELPTGWAAPSLSLLRVKWLIQANSWGRAKVRIKMPGSCCMFPLFYHRSSSLWHSGNLEQWFSKLSLYQNPLEGLLRQYCWVPLPTFLSQGVWDGLGKLHFFHLLWFILFFYWCIVDLQCCVNFCCTGKWFTFLYIYIYIYIHTHTHTHSFFFILFSIGNLHF